MIPVYQPLLGDTEKKYVLDALDSTWISSRGEYLDRFETSFAEYVEASEGVAVCNGTVAIHLALVALGVGPGDEVIVPTFTYVASVNAITYTGATPVFVDSDDVYWNLDPDHVEARITPRTKAIMVVHLYGHPADMGKLLEIAGRHGIPIVEDAAEAHGAMYEGRKVGCIGDIGSFSFFGNKVITTGEGGMVVTNNAELARRCRHYRGQGVSQTRTYWHDVVGFNYRMTNIAAAIGVAQLERIDDVLAAKRGIAMHYSRRLADLPGVTFQKEAPWATSVWWMVSTLVSPELRDPLREFLASRDVETRPFFYPAHTLPMYSSGEVYPVAQKLGASGINLPSSPGLTSQEIDHVCDAVEEFMHAHAG